jgi:hypothetical protein
MNLFEIKAYSLFDNSPKADIGCPSPLCTNLGPSPLTPYLGLYFKGDSSFSLWRYLSLFDADDILDIFLGFEFKVMLGVMPSLN